MGGSAGTDGRQCYKTPPRVRCASRLSSTEPARPRAALSREDKRHDADPSISVCGCSAGAAAHGGRLRSIGGAALRHQRAAQDGVGDAGPALPEAGRGRQQGQSQDQRLPQLAAGLRAGHSPASRAGPHRLRGLLHHRRLAAGAGDLAAQHPLHVQGPEGAGLRLRQSPDQADPGHVPQEGRGHDRLERGWRRRHHRQEALYLSRRAQGSQGALGPEQGRSLHVEPVRCQPQSAAGDGVEFGLPDRPHRRRRTRRRPSTSSPAFRSWLPSSP